MAGTLSALGTKQCWQLHRSASRRTHPPDKGVQRLQGRQRGGLRLALPLLQRLAVQQQGLQQQLAAVQAAEEAAPGGGGKVEALLREEQGGMEERERRAVGW